MTYLQLTPRLLAEWADCSPLLRKIVLAAVEYWPAGRGPVRITSIWRTAAEEAAAGGKSGIHCAPAPYRACDLGARELTQDEIIAICTAVNDFWEYDPQRQEKVVAYGAVHGSGPHIHCQVHPNSVERRH